jgi:hypothetical protein
MLTPRDKSCPCYAIRELSVVLRRGNYQMYRTLLGLLAGVSEHGFCEGAALPTDEVWKR